MPNYPAVLGIWKFNLLVNQVNKTMVNSPGVKSYTIIFTVNTSLMFTFEKLLIQKRFLSKEFKKLKKIVRSDESKKKILAQMRTISKEIIKYEENTNPYTAIKIQTKAGQGIPID